MTVGKYQTSQKPPELRRTDLANIQCAFIVEKLSWKISLNPFGLRTAELVSSYFTVYDDVRGANTVSA